MVHVARTAFFCFSGYPVRIVSGFLSSSLSLCVGKRPCTLTIAEPFRSKFLSVAGLAENLLIPLRESIAVQTLPTLTALEAGLVPDLATTDRTFSVVNGLATAAAFFRRAGGNVDVDSSRIVADSRRRSRG